MAFKRTGFRVSSCVVALPEDVRQVLCKKGHKKQVFVLPHGVELKDFCPTKDMVALREKLGLNGLVVGYMGRLTEEKGVIDFVRSLFTLSRKGVKFQSLIVDSRHYEEKIKRTVDSLGLSGLVT